MQTELPENKIIWTSEDGRFRIVQTWCENEFCDDPTEDPPFFSRLELEQQQGSSLMGDPIWSIREDKSGLPVFDPDYLEQLLVQFGLLPKPIEV